MIMMGDKKKLASVILGPKPEEPKEDMSPLKVAAQELVEAVHAKDIDGVVDALRAAFQECDAEPHIEGPESEEE